VTHLAPGTALDVVVGPDTYPIARIGTLDPRNAMADALATFLRCATFRRGGGLVADEDFALERVEPWWPDPKFSIDYPSASIIEIDEIPYEAHALTPTPLEHTWHVYGDDTVVWKTGEAVVSFQVDLWATDDPTREAMLARLPSLFNPGEGYAGVLLEGEAGYFRAPVRATLLEYERIDTPETVYGRERRALCVVRCEVDVLQLRCAVPLDPRVRLIVTEGDATGIRIVVVIPFDAIMRDSDDLPIARNSDGLFILRDP